MIFSNNSKQATEIFEILKTEATQSALEKVLTNNRSIDKNKIKRVLLLYDNKEHFIGDSCLTVGRLQLLKSFFQNASIDINWRDKRYTYLYTALLKNNPYINKYSDFDWSEIDYSNYDIVFCATYEERKLLEILIQKCFLDINQFSPIFLSISNQMLLFRLGKLDTVFPEYEELSEYAAGYEYTHHLYISPEEKEWANKWLEGNGISKNERIFIVLDSSSSRAKLLKMDVYFEVLSYLCKIERSKVLIFDEKNIGKREFYSEWLGEEKVSKIIFSEKLTLRQDLCLIGSDYTKLVFGPCTGLLHCASAIYNHFLNIGVSPDKIPRLVTYTGKYEIAGQTAQHWWGAAPLIDCLIIRQTAGGKEILLLSDLDDQEKKDTTALLPCNEYTSSMIIDFLAEQTL